MVKFSQSKQLASSPEGSQNLGIQCWGASVLPLAEVWKSALHIDDASQNFGLIEDPDTLSAVPCDSKMSCQLMASCSKRSGVGTSLYAISLMKNVFGLAFFENPPLIYLVCYRFISLVLSELHILSPLTGLFR